MRTTILTAIVLLPCFWPGPRMAGAVELDDLPQDVRDSIDVVSMDWSPYRSSGSVVRTKDLVHAKTVSLSLLPSPVGDASGAVAPARLNSRIASLLATWRHLLARGRLDEESMAQWVLARGIDQATLIEALDSIPLDHPMDPIYIPLCAILVQQMGDGQDAYLGLPVSARMAMAMYLAVLGREEQARRLLESVSWLEQVALDRMVPMYHVANELIRYRGNASPGLAIWALKQGAMHRGARDRAFVCSHIRAACEQAGSAEMVRDQLIPWAEEALAMPGSEPTFRIALRSLVWGYEYVAQPAKALERGLYWLAQASERRVPVPDLATSLVGVSDLLAAADRADEAARLLRQAIEACEPSSGAAARMQAQLLELARDNPDMGNVSILPAKYEAVIPERVTLEVSAVGPSTTYITVKGSPTLEVLGVKADHPLVRAEAVAPRMVEDKSIHKITIRCVPGGEWQAGEHVLTITTSDPEHACVGVPLQLRPTNPITVQPDELFYGFVTCGATKALRVELSAEEPFTIKGAVSDRPGNFTIDVAESLGGRYVLNVSLRAPHTPGLMEGHIDVETTLAAHPKLRIAYYAQVRGDK